MITTVHSITTTGKDFYHQLVDKKKGANIAKLEGHLSDAKQNAPKFLKAEKFPGCLKIVSKATRSDRPAVAVIDTYYVSRENLVKAQKYIVKCGIALSEEMAKA